MTTMKAFESKKELRVFDWHWTVFRLLGGLIHSIYKAQIKTNLKSYTSPSLGLQWCFDLPVTISGLLKLWQHLHQFRCLVLCIFASIFFHFHETSLMLCEAFHIQHEIFLNSCLQAAPQVPFMKYLEIYHQKEDTV